MFFPLLHLLLVTYSISFPVLSLSSWSSRSSWISSQSQRPCYYDNIICSFVSRHYHHDDHNYDNNDDNGNDDLLLSTTKSTDLDDKSSEYDNNGDDSQYVSLLCEKDVAEIQKMVDFRIDARTNKQYDKADYWLDKIYNYSKNTASTSEYAIQVQDLINGKSIWKIIPSKGKYKMYKQKYLSSTVEQTILQFAHNALGLAVTTSTQNSLHRAYAAATINNDVSLLSQREDNSNNSNNDDNENIYNNIESALQILVEKAKTRLSHILQSDPNFILFELGGRKAADAAFWFSLSGCTDQLFINQLADITVMELERYGLRSRCRSKDIYHILERFAAAGLRQHGKLRTIAMACLSTKLLENNNDTKSIGSSLDLHSERSLLLIWKFSTKQKKQYAFLRSAQKHWERRRQQEQQQEENVIASLSPRTGNNIFNNKIHNNCHTTFNITNKPDIMSRPHCDTPNHSFDWKDIFEDPTRPLVVDIGSGFGVSLIGLASSSTTDSQDAKVAYSSQLLLQHDDDDDIGNSILSWSDCNFVGIDLGGLGIGYAQGISQRWNITNKLQFIVDTAEDFVQKLQTYPGEIRLVMIQFPTPYRLSNKTKDNQGGNSQLPTTKENGFMVTINLLKSIYLYLDGTKGKLFLQSNVEDVAVYMRNLAYKIGFDNNNNNLVDDTIPINDKTAIRTITTRVPQRQLDWIQMGGERAIGPGWFYNPILHPQAFTETEAACIQNGTPIHRCILRKKTKKN